MYVLIKSLLFLLPAETAHKMAVVLLKATVGLPIIGFLWKKAFRFDHPNLETRCFGLTFRNPVGLAAGFDKNGDYIHAMASLGFGFIELGTVTPRPQAGNSRPRLFRLLKDDALINRMGFNNKGVDHLAKNLEKTRPPGLIIGGNIGKNKDTPNNEAWKDYLICFQKLYDLVDYFVVNLSSPNTPGLRALQEKEPLRHLVKKLTDERSKKRKYRPILLKIAPDIHEEMLKDILAVTQSLKIDGIIATNTTVARDNLKTPRDHLDKIGNGGLSGKPLLDRSDRIVALARKCTPGLPIIGVGGINAPEDARQKINCGAQLIQLYSGMIFYGPGLIKDIKKLLSSQITSK